MTPGLHARLAEHHRRLCRDKSTPWLGLGLVRDLESVMQLLSLQEFGAWLRTHPDPELQQWANEVLDADATLTAVDDVHDYPDDPVRAVEVAGETIADVRQVLVGFGALDADDTETPIGDLLRALLS